MDFYQLAEMRQSTRKYDEGKTVEDGKLSRILECARLAPSACNGQPYLITVCRGDKAKAVAKETTGMGMNKFAVQAPVLIVLSEAEYVKTAALGAKVKGNDYRSLDIGIVCAHIALAAAEEGLGSCILGWFDDKAIRKLIGVDSPVRLVITIGYPAEGDMHREKKRKSMDALVRFAE
ncbi:MAG: nitroreductase family protein [Clostridia bacterium]|nr:nitroreductase family protein [Clostridia bacterium]